MFHIVTYTSMDAAAAAVVNRSSRRSAAAAAAPRRLGRSTVPLRQRNAQFSSVTRFGNEIMRSLVAHIADSTNSTCLWACRSSVLSWPAWPCQLIAINQRFNYL